MPATAFPAMLDALVDGLQDQSGLSGVEVFGCPVAPEDLGRESIELASETDVTQTVAAMGSQDVEEEFSVKGSIICYAPIAGSAGKTRSINLAAKSARDRACEILGEVESLLAADDTLAGTVRDAHTTDLKLSQGMAPEGQLGRVCLIEFTITAQAHTTP